MALDTERVKIVTEELTRLAQRLTDRAFIFVGNKPPLDMPNLCKRATDHFPHEWAKDPIIALEITLRHGITKLDGSFGKISAQEAAFRLFNMDGEPNFPDIKKSDVEYLGDDGDKKYNELRNDLRERAGLVHAGSSTVRSKLNGLKRALARVLLDPNFPFSTVVNHSVSEPSGLAVKPVPPNHFVPRIHLEKNLHILLASGERLILLHGDGGMGKSTLARRFAQQLAPPGTAVPLIDCEEATETYRSMIELLANHNIEEPPNLVLAERRLTRLLTERDAPTVLVLDNVTKADVIERLIPRDTVTIVIVTSRQRVLPSDWGSILPIGAMRADEALQLANSHLPYSNQGQLAKLVKKLSHHPLAIEHACAYLRQSNSQSITKVSASLDKDIVEVLDCVAQNEQRTLFKTPCN